MMNPLRVAAVLVLAGHVSGQSRASSPMDKLSVEDLNAAMKDPDAGGEFSIPDPSGFDLSKKWPGEAASGWKARIEIKAHAAAAAGSSQFTTLTRISYVPPSSVEVTANDTARFTATDSSWYPCSNLWVSSRLRSSSADTDAACSALPGACRDDLQKSLEGGFFGSWDSQFRGPHCPPTRNPDSCRSTFGNGTQLLGAEPQRNNPLTAFNLDQWYYYERDDVHDKGNTTAYEAALARVWVLGTTWGFSRHSEYANADKTPDVASTVTCLRASEEKKGVSQDDGQGGGAKDESRGSLVGRGASLATVFACLGLALAL